MMEILIDYTRDEINILGKVRQKVKGRKIRVFALSTELCLIKIALGNTA